MINSTGLKYFTNKSKQIFCYCILSSHLMYASEDLQNVYSSLTDDLFWGEKINPFNTNAID